jgi:hypothetical protein
MPSFAERLERIQQECQNNLALLVAPRLTKLPLVIQSFDDPFLPYAKAIINATRGQVCAYVFDLAAYLSIGAAGAVALERTIAYAKGETLTILHGPFAGADYVSLMDERSFNADGVTLVHREDVPAYTIRDTCAVFVMMRGQPQRGDMTYSGIYWQDASLLTLPSSGSILQIRLEGEDILYAAMSEDFAEQTAAALEKLR